MTASQPTYQEAVRALTDRGRFGVRLGLGRIRALLREVGDPQRALRGALVAGTNGKGSVLALAGSALHEAGYRVGQTPKPHLVSYRERLQIGGRPIEPAAFARLVGELLPAVDRVARRHGDPTEFEFVTAMLFCWFARENVDVALVEVGLGGRLDATHAWDGGVAAITNVDLDHTQWLGPTVEAIAREKAAIIERGDLAVSGAQEPALTIIRRRARRLGVPLTVVRPGRIVALDRDGLVVDLASRGPTRIGLRGRHQAANAAVADALLDALDAAGIASAPSTARARGYVLARWPGRLELLEVDGRDVLLDGAHNPAGAAALAVALDDLRPYLTGGGEAQPPPMTLVTASMADKDVDGIVGALAAAGAMQGARIICTRIDVSRGLDPALLAARWAAAGATQRPVIEPDPASAFDRALREARGPIVVAGSLYLVGAIRGRLVDDPLLRDPEDQPAQ